MIIVGLTECFFFWGGEEGPFTSRGFFFLLSVYEREELKLIPTSWRVLRDTVLFRFVYLVFRLFASFKPMLLGHEACVMDELPFSSSSSFVIPSFPHPLLIS